MKNQRLLDWFIGLELFVIGILLFLSLISGISEYNPSYSMFKQPNYINNYGGVLGGFLALKFSYHFGILSIIFPLLLILWAVMILLEKIKLPLKITLFTILFWLSIIPYFGIIFSNSERIIGIKGVNYTLFLQGLFGIFFTLLLSFLLFMTLLLIILKIDIKNVLSRFKKVKKMVRRMRFWNYTV